MKKIIFVCLTVALSAWAYPAAAEAQVTFASNGQQLNNFVGRGVALADFTGDEAIDAFVANESGQNSQYRIYFGDGHGQFADSGLRLGTEWSWEVAVGDVNKDGLPDLFVVNLGIDRSAPPENMMKGRFAEVWLNTSRKKCP